MAQDRGDLGCGDWVECDSDDGPGTEGYRAAREPDEAAGIRLTAAFGDAGNWPLPRGDGVKGRLAVAG